MSDKKEAGDQPARSQDVTIDISYEALPVRGPDGSPVHVKQFGILDHEKNTNEKPNKEATFTMPHLVRRIDSREILPRPLTSTNQLICLSYLSLLFCCCIGAFATHKAMKAKILRNKGIYNSAERRAKHACRLILAAVACGVLIYAFVILIVVLNN